MSQKSRNTKKKKTLAAAVKREPQQFSWKRFVLKIVLVFAAVVAVVAFCDHKGYFRSNQANNHINRKWSSFYNFTKYKSIDILILGNSHVTTGVDPFVLSVATGTNSFIMAQSGVSIQDSWFELGEILKHTTPRLIVIETYGINDIDAETVIPLTQSFEAHRDFWYKLGKMPALFRSDYWVQAWSPTIRNHSFLLKDKQQIQFNKENPVLPEQQKLDLGRFARFDTGLQDSTIAKYDRLGAPVDGAEFKISDHTKKYLAKIMSMCAEKHIQVLFLTVPMYYKHVKNYSAWKNTLGAELQKYPSAQWLNLQEPYDSTTYTKEAFENTYSENQHQSNYGMILTAYKLADYIKKNHYDLPDRSNETQWIEDFWSTDHFLYNQYVVHGEPNAISILRDKQIGNLKIKELALKSLQQNNLLILKVEKDSTLPNSIILPLNIEFQNKQMPANIQMTTAKDVNPPAHKVYIAGIDKNVKILGINN